MVQFMYHPDVICVRTEEKAWPWRGPSWATWRRDGATYMGSGGGDREFFHGAMYYSTIASRLGENQGTRPQHKYHVRMYIVVATPCGEFPPPISTSLVVLGMSYF
jgi:hypothetical protein